MMRILGSSPLAATATPEIMPPPDTGTTIACSRPNPCSSACFKKNDNLKVENFFLENFQGKSLIGEQ